MSGGRAPGRRAGAGSPDAGRPRYFTACVVLHNLCRKPASPGVAQVLHGVVTRRGRTGTDAGSSARFFSPRFFSPGRRPRASCPVPHPGTYTFAGYVHSGRLRTRRTARFLVSTYIFAGRERAGECTYPAGVYVTEKRVRNRSECTYPEARRGSARLGGQIEAKRQSAGRARRTCGQKCGDIVKGFDPAV